MCGPGVSELTLTDDHAVNVTELQKIKEGREEGMMDGEDVQFSHLLTYKGHMVLHKSWRNTTIKTKTTDTMKNQREFEHSLNAI